MQSDLHVDVRFGHPDGFELDIDLSVEAGSMTKLIGPSGSGKSTVLSLIAGFLQPTDGAIRHGESILFSISPAIDEKPWKRNVGLLFQSDTLFPHLSVRKNLLYGATKKVKTPWTLESVCEQFEIGEYLDRTPSQLSGGQRDRVSLGRTLLTQPQILLLDEPLNSVEARLRQKIVDFVAEGVEQLKIPTLLVSHDANLHSDNQSRIFQIENGRVTTL